MSRRFLFLYIVCCYLKLSVLLYPGLLSENLIRPGKFGMVHLPGILSAAKFPQLIACICRLQEYSTPILTKQVV